LNEKENVIEEIQKQVINDIKENGIILICVNSKGDITLVTSGEITKPQSKVAEQMLITMDPSFVLKTILWLEATFLKLEVAVSDFLSKIFKV